MSLIVEGIYLRRLDFKILPENLEDLDYNLKVSCQSFYPEDDVLIQEITFDVAHELKRPPFLFKFTLVSQFRKLAPDEDSSLLDEQDPASYEPSLKEFSEVHGPAYAVPYARELIANLTSRAGVLPTLVIPPVNIYKLMDDGLHEKGELTLGLDATPRAKFTKNKEPNSD